MWTAWLLAGTLLVAMPTFARGETRATAAADSKQAVEAQVVIDGKVVGSFTDVSGLSITVEEVATLCPIGGGNCDDNAWQTAALRAVWQVGSAADDFEQTAWLSTKAKHDMAMNAIRNLKRMARQVEESLTDPAATLKTKHDTAKNSINNVRLVVADLTDTAGQEAGVDQAALRRLTDAVGVLETVDTGWVVRYRPGRPTYGNITLTGPQGSGNALFEWYRRVLDGKVERKSGSVILLDRSGTEVARYNFFEAWPCQYSATLASEQIELAVDRVERVSR
jgi:hypothetical protein